MRQTKKKLLFFHEVRKLWKQFQIYRKNLIVFWLVLSFISNSNRVQTSLIYDVNVYDVILLSALNHNKVKMMRLDFREAFGICKTCVTGVLLYPLIKFLQWWVHYEVTSHFMIYIYCVLILDEFTRTWLNRHEHFVFLQYYMTTPYY